MSKQEILLTSTDYTDTALLSVVRAPEDWGVFASTGPNFRHTVFGRDSIEVAEDILPHDQLLARNIIITLARLQGTGYNSQSEEEKGKIHHEYRTTHFANAPIPEHSLKIMRKLQEIWGDPDDDTMLYYGSTDATPLYMRLVQKYTAEYGDDILHQTFLNKDGAETSVLDSVHSAADWLVGKLNQREDKLLAYRRMNPRGIENQVWKDSRTAYLFSDGTMPDHDKGVVSTELQGYAYDALLYAAQIFPARADEFKQLAGQVQHSTIEKLWMPKEQFFAQGLGIHESGEERVIDTLTSNGALILDSKILEDLPDWPRDMYANAIEKMMIEGPEFLTPAGIRCRAVRHANLLPYVDYHGSYAVWAKETHDVARGLARFGRAAGAAILHNSIVRSFQVAGEFYELFYVDLDNTVYYDQTEAIAHFSSSTMGEPLPVPEPGQAWSISAAISSARFLQKQDDKKIPRQRAFRFWNIPRQRPAQPRKLLLQMLMPVQTAFKRRERRK